MPELLRFTLKSLTDKELEIKIKNTSGASLAETLVIQFYPPMYLVSEELNEAAIEAANVEDPPGSKNLKGIVNGPEGWTVWARRETSDSSLFIVFINDLDESGNIKPPVKLAANAEFIVRIPLDPEANQASVNLLYSYQHGSNPKDSGSLDLEPEPLDWTPDVTFAAHHPSPTAIPPATRVKISWSIKDGVSATLRGPLPGGNSELELNETSKTNLKLSEGSLEVTVVTSMIFLLQAEVKRPDGNPNVNVVRMLWLDTSNKKHLYISPRPTTVLPYGLIEIDWAAWGVNEVKIAVGKHTSRNIPLTQQTLGHYYEGSGVMRVSATHTIDNVRTTSEAIVITAGDETPKTKSVQVISWMSMEKPNIQGVLLGIAMNAPRIAVLTTQGLYIANVGNADPSPPAQKLPLTLKTPIDQPIQWGAVAAVENRFLCWRRIDPSPDYQVAPFTLDGNPDEIPPLTLPADIRNVALAPHAIFDFVGLGTRAYLVMESPQPSGIVRRAFSVAFNSKTKKAEYRSEPLLEPLVGYRLVAFDRALYALNRTSGQMFRFGVTTTGVLEQPRKAASAVRKAGTGGQEESMIAKGLIVPLGRNLVVLGPKSVPSVESLEQYGLKNILNYEQPETDSDSVPQDLFYNPQKDYWGRCGHDLDIKDTAAMAVFRAGTSPRLWVIQRDGEQHTLHTLAAGAEDLFVHDYKPEYLAKPLAPYLTKKRNFLIKCQGFTVGPINQDYGWRGITEFSSEQPAVVPLFPTREVKEFAFDLHYNEANPGSATIRQQLAHLPGLRTDANYLLEVTFAGPDLSTATSCFRRIALTPRGLLNEEVAGSRMTHSTSSPIQVAQPTRFAERLKLVMVNSSKDFRIKAQGMRSGNSMILDQSTTLIDHMFEDFTLVFEGKVATQGVIGVKLNFALPNGIEASSERQPQTKLIRLTNDNAKKIEIMLVKMLLPNDPPLTLPGTAPIQSQADRAVFVCQLNYKV